MVWKIEGPIVVPYNFGDSSHLAIDKALQLALSSTQIHVVHAVAPMVALAADGMPMEWSEDQARLEQSLVALRQEFSKSGGDPRFAAMKLEAFVGDPGFVCSERAQELGAELMIIPSYGRSGLVRLILGSVAEDILRQSKCPVLVLKI